MAVKVTEEGCPRCGATFHSWSIRPETCYCDEPDPSTTGHRPFMPYYDNLLGRMVTGPKQKERILKEFNLQEAGGEYKKHVAGTAMTPRPVDLGISRAETDAAIRRYRESHPSSGEDD